mgnify:CR=1 FL=1
MPSVPAAGCRLASALGRWSIRLGPGADVIKSGVNRLPDPCCELCAAVQYQISDRNTIAANKSFPFHLSVKPSEPILG